MRLVVLVACSVVTATAAARSLDDAYAHRLMRARTAREADSLRARYDDVRVARMRCALQLGRGLTPLACYDALAFERDWGVVTPPEAARRRAELDHRCVRAAAGLRTPEGLRSLRHVSPRCA